MNLSDVSYNPSPQLQVGDICYDCQQNGIENRLRLFIINLEEETLLKCESDNCMYPYNDDILTSSDEGDDSNYTITELVNCPENYVETSGIIVDNFLDFENNLQNASPSSLGEQQNLNEIKIDKKKPVKKSKQVRTSSKSSKKNTANLNEIFTKNASMKSEETKSVAINNTLSKTLEKPTKCKPQERTKLLPLPTTSVKLEKSKDKSKPPSAKVESNKPKRRKEIKTEVAAKADTKEDEVPKASLCKGHQYLKMIKASEALNSKIRTSTKIKKKLIKPDL